MRSYQAARSSFGFLEFIAGTLVLVGIIAIIPAFMALGNSGPIALLGALPGVAIMAIGFFGQAYTQAARATVDSAEYAQQSLKLARGQYEISKQLLQHTTGTPSAATYTAGDAAIELEDIQYDTEVVASEPKPPLTPDQRADRARQYPSRRIEGNEGKSMVEDKSNGALGDPKLAIDRTPPGEKII